MIGENDLDLIFESGDFDTEAVFDTGAGDVTVKGWFTAASQGVSMMSNVEVEAAKPSFTAPTRKLTAVRTKQTVTIDEVDYTVERIEPVGNGVTVVWLKT